MKLHQIAVGAVGERMTDGAATPCGPSALSFASSDDIARFMSELAWLQVSQIITAQKSAPPSQSSYIYRPLMKQTEPTNARGYAKSVQPGWE